MAKETTPPVETSGPPACPVCKGPSTGMKEGTWPRADAGYLLVANGIFFLIFFAWMLSGALVPPKEPPTGGGVFLLAFRNYLPAIAGLACLYWGWAVLTGRRKLGKDPAWICDTCGNATAK